MNRTTCSNMQCRRCRRAHTRISANRGDMTMNAKRVLAGLALAVAATGTAACSSSASGSGNTDRSVQYDESQVVDYLGLSSTDGDISWQYDTDEATQCNIAVILTSASDVETYAGDNIAANPAKTAGVKIVDPEGATCKRQLTEALKGFPPK